MLDMSFHYTFPFVLNAIDDDDIRLSRTRTRTHAHTHFYFCEVSNNIICYYFLGQQLWLGAGASVMGNSSMDSDSFEVQGRRCSVDNI